MTDLYYRPAWEGQGGGRGRRCAGSCVIRFLGGMTVTATRFAELGYEQQDKGLWRIVTTEDGRAVGPHYKSKAELLADLQRYATDYGCDQARSTFTELLMACKDVAYVATETGLVDFRLAPEVLKRVQEAIAMTS